MPLPTRRRVSLRIAPVLALVLGGCSFLDFETLTSQHGVTSGAGPGGQTTGGASGDGGEGGRAGNAGRGGDDTGGAGNGGIGGMPDGGDGGGGGDGATGGSPNPDGGSGGTDGGSTEMPLTCENGQQDNDETDDDCGGRGTCPRCEDGATCRTDTDCRSGSCPQGGRCEPPTCYDNRENGNETGMDCGGPDDCAPCPVGDRCELPRDCEIPLNSQNLCTEENRCDSECLGDFLDCDTTKGCEVDSSDDLDHCGDCDVQCSDANGTPDCNDGTCEIACDTGYKHCTSEPDSGCETNISTSEAHCGDCNLACADECVSGECCVELAPDVNRPMTSCFTVNPEPECDSITVQKQDPGSVAYTTTSMCNTAAGTIQGNGATVNLAVCRTTFHLASAANVRWWKSGCD